MRISLGRPAGLLTLALVSSGLVAILLLTALSAQSTAGSLPTSGARSVGAASVAPSRVFHSLPSLNVPRSPAAEEAFAAWPEQPLAADFGARQATVTPTPTDASTSTATPTPDSSPTATATVTEEPTPTETATPDGTPTVTPSPTPLVPTTSIRKVYLPVLIHVPSGMQPPLAPSLRHIDSPGGQLTYLLSWTPVLGAASYELQQAATPDFDRDVQSVYQGQDSAFDMPSHGIGTFYYRVRARNVAGASDWSEVRSADVSWETEPNSLLTAANSGLVSGQTIYALPDDPNDFFHVTTTKAGSITAQIEGIVGESVRLVLYSDNIGNVIATDTTAPYEIRAYREPGNYYIRVFVGMGHSATTPYRLVVTYK